MTTTSIVEHFYVVEDIDTGGHCLVGGSPEVRRLAQQWLNAKRDVSEASQEEHQDKQEKRGSRRFFWSSS